VRRALYRPLERSAAWALAAAALLGAAGSWPRAAHGPDPFAELAWLALLAPAAGFFCGAFGARLFPLGLAPPGLWMFALVEADLAGDRDLAAPLAPGLVAAGAYLAGLGLGAACGRALAWRGAGLLLLAAAALALLPLAPGRLAGEGALAATHPALAGRLLELTPLAPAFDAARWDWAHANPPTYRLAGVEWLGRAPWHGGLAALAFLVVGCASAALLPLVGKAGDGPLRS
jgi:hypothetical protein